MVVGRERTPLREALLKLRNQYQESFENEGARIFDVIALVSHLDAILALAPPAQSGKETPK